MNKLFSTIPEEHIAKLSTTVFWSFISIACLYKLWLSSVVPFTVTMSYPGDQTWFFKNALSISSGKWLGESYNHYTLIKGPVYSLFLSAVSNLGISPKLAIDMLYVFASLTFLLALRISLNNKFAIALGFVLVLGNPITFSDFWAEPLRINIYTPLVLIYLSSLIALLAFAYEKPDKLPVHWMLLCGASLALAWNTREESIWMLSSLGPLMLITLWRIWQKKHLTMLLLSWAIIISIPTATWHYLAGINETHYGFKGISEFKGTQFVRAANALYSLNTADDDKPYHYLSQTTIDKLNAISTRTRRLAKAMLKDDGITFKKKSAALGSHSSWAIRSAMAKDGYYKNFAETELAYQKIAKDIEDYCQQNADNCRKTYIPGLLLKPEGFKRIDDNLIRGLQKLIRFQHFPPALSLEKRKRGDRKFQYLVNRFFNMHTDFNSEYERLSDITKTETQRKNMLKKIHQRYQNDYFPLLTLTIIIAILTVLLNKQWQPKMIGLMLLGSFAGSFGIYLLIISFVAHDLARAIVSSSIPMLCFSAYFLGLGVQSILNRLKYVANHHFFN
ncbi:MAG: hypothetical protein ACRBHB_11405 [Arenicella sp.]